MYVYGKVRPMGDGLVLSTTLTIFGRVAALTLGRNDWIGSENNAGTAQRCLLALSSLRYQRPKRVWMRINAKTL